MLTRECAIANTSLGTWINTSDNVERFLSMQKEKAKLTIKEDLGSCWDLFSWSDLDKLKLCH